MILNKFSNLDIDCNNKYCQKISPVQGLHLHVREAIWSTISVEHHASLRSYLFMFIIGLITEAADIRAADRSLPAPLKTPN